MRRTSGLRKHKKNARGASKRQSLPKCNRSRAAARPPSARGVMGGPTHRSRSVRTCCFSGAQAEMAFVRGGRSTLIPKTAAHQKVVLMRCLQLSPRTVIKPWTGFRTTRTATYPLRKIAPFATRYCTLTENRTLSPKPGHDTGGPHRPARSYLFSHIDTPASFSRI